MHRSTSTLAGLDLHSLTDVAIIQLIARREEDEAIARAAFQEFYERQEEYLAAVARKVCRQFPGTANELFEAVVQNTFVRVFERANTFDTQKMKASQQAASIKAWLGRIADNEHKALLKQLVPRTQLSIVEDLAIYEADYAYDPAQESATVPLSVNEALLEEALSILTEAERYILINSMAYEEEGKYLPSDFITSTCDKFSISKVNFRKIKSLALKKVNARIAHLQALKT
jgi:DNA-directed RNA polymerase specialized sigma24 family protein